VHVALTAPKDLRGIETFELPAGNRKKIYERQQENARSLLFLRSLQRTFRIHRSPDHERFQKLRQRAREIENLASESMRKATALSGNER
jgi:hypothetical protein